MKTFLFLFAAVTAASFSRSSAEPLERAAWFKKQEPNPLRVGYSCYGAHVSPVKGDVAGLACSRDSDKKKFLAFTTSSGLGLFAGVGVYHMIVVHRDRDCLAYNPSTFRVRKVQFGLFWASFYIGGYSESPDSYYNECAWVRLIGPGLGYGIAFPKAQLTLEPLPEDGSDQAEDGRKRGNRPGETIVPKNPSPAEEDFGHREPLRKGPRLR
jgi:hypothetical protein